MNETLHQRIAVLEGQIAAILKLTGLSVEDWVSPNKAESLISLSRYQVNELIKKAEAARDKEQRCSLQLGEHYRYIPPSNTVQVNWRRWEEFLAMPPEQREGLE